MLLWGDLSAQRFKFLILICAAFDSGFKITCGKYLAASGWISLELDSFLLDSFSS